MLTGAAQIIALHLVPLHRAGSGQANVVQVRMGRVGKRVCFVCALLGRNCSAGTGVNLTRFAGHQLRFTWFLLSQASRFIVLVVCPFDDRLPVDGIYAYYGSGPGPGIRLKWNC